MLHIVNSLMSLFRPSFDAGAFATVAEPLDHPCLAKAGRAFIDDLPLPSFAVSRDGVIKLVGEQ